MMMATTKKKMKRYRKPILLTLLFLLAGAVVNVAVAWTIAWGWRATNQEWFGDAVSDGSFDEAALLLEWPLPVPQPEGGDEETWPNQPEVVERLRVWLGGVVVHERRHATVDEPSRLGNIEGGFPSYSHTMSVETWGWPLRSLENRGGTNIEERAGAWEKDERLWAANQPGWVYAGFDAGLWRVDPPGDRQITFALRPRPLAFTANSVFFGSLLAGLCFAPFALRRWARRKRGACLACGYSLRGHPAAGVCPECGHAAKVASDQASAPSAHAKVLHRR